MVPLPGGWVSTNHGPYLSLLILSPLRSALDQKFKNKEYTIFISVALVLVFFSDDAVVYLNLEGGNGGEACPSIADSSAVSLSQMAFLSMTVSIFSVVARY